jgi:hypothetical protein
MTTQLHAVTNTPNGDTFIECWGNKCKLTLYIDKKGNIEYITSNNANINDMTDGKVETAEQLIRLLTWVTEYVPT